MEFRIEVFFFGGGGGGGEGEALSKMPVSHCKF